MVIRVSVLISKRCTGLFVSESCIYSFPNDLGEDGICQTNHFEGQKTKDNTSNTVRIITATIQ